MTGTCKTKNLQAIRQQVLQVGPCCLARIAKHWSSTIPSHHGWSVITPAGLWGQQTCGGGGGGGGRSNNARHGQYDDSMLGLCRGTLRTNSGGDKTGMSSYWSEVQGQPTCCVAVCRMGQGASAY